jgi:CheY-like chemotaxis protein
MTAEPKRILLVEDDRVLRRACEASLRRKGFHVTIAVDGQAALDELEAWTGPLPDLILLDLLMPRLTGIEVLRALRADPRTKAVPVLILSNSSREQDQAQIDQFEIAGYLVKSNLSLQELGEHVARLLGD